jgi:hypothetical protein
VKTARCWLIAGCGKRETGHRRIVTAVDDVVRDARMIWLLVVELVEDGHGGFGIGKIGVAVGT